ncbi:hypothetical protein C3K47_14595 [Solitalea longa]|uniref:Uncharacterized protein n=1 Tax=Solitalea longa TaxID=2079460 RepID=A0A2S5A064_9SPHI|nr:hypothetical protein C3K47_14595 [Solitalea longa]
MDCLFKMHNRFSRPIVVFIIKKYTLVKIVTIPMNYVANIDIFGLYLLPVLLISFINYNRAEENYKPVLWYFFLLAILKMLDTLFMLSFGNNIIIYNLEGILSFLLLLYIYKRWGYFSSRKHTLNYIALIAISFFTIETLVNKSMLLETSYSKAAFSFTSIILSLNVINNTLFSTKSRSTILFKNLFCITIIIESILLICLSIFLNPRLKFSMTFLESIYLFYRISVVFIISSIYLIVSFLIPKKSYINKTSINF